MLGFLDFIGEAVCHQALERSFLISGKPLLVCARCSGLYISFLFAFIFLSQTQKEYQPKKDFILALALVFPLTFEGVLSYFGFWQTNNYFRWATGVLAGFSFALLLLPGYFKDVSFQQSFLPYFFNRAKAFSMVFMLLLVLRFSGQYYLENFLIASGIFILFLLINYFWLDFIFKKRKRNFRAFLFAALLSVGELALLGYLHIFLRFF